MKAFKKNKKWGLKDDSGVVVIPAKYDEVGDFIEFDEDYILGASCAPVCLDEKWALRKLGEEDNFSTEFTYDYICPIINSWLYLLECDGTFSVCNVMGEKVIPFEFSEIGQRGLICKVTKDNKLGLFCINGLRWVEPMLEEVKFVPDDFLKVKKDGKWGWIDKNNEFTEDEDSAFWGDNEVFEEGICED